MTAKSRRVDIWPVYLLALPAFVAIWSGWVGLGEMAGFGIVHPLPGIWDDAELNTAITLPIGVETYAAYALYVWLGSDRASAAAKRFARNSAIGSLILGAAGQIVFHVLVAAGWDKAPVLVVVAVACLPVAVLGMGSALAHLLRQVPEGVPVPSERLPEAPVSPAAWTIGPQLPDVPTAAELVGMTDAERKACAIETVERCRAEGIPLTGAALGRAYGRSERWGSGLVKELTPAE